MSKSKIGIICSGGDCPGLNTVTDAIVKTLGEKYEIIGFYKGLEGLLSRDYTILTPAFADKSKYLGGTYLKTVNKGNFAGKTGNGQFNQIDQNVLDTALASYKELGLESLVILGGDGSFASAIQLQKMGINIVGVPKSIDNDLAGTDFTFGFQTAVQTVTDALDKITDTGDSHDRTMIVEVMGRNAGWIATYAGIAGGANVILVPEIKFDTEKVLDFLKQRHNQGNYSSLMVVAEGAMTLSSSVFKKNLITEGEVKLGGIGAFMENYINKNCEDIEARNVTLGHIQRGGSPVAMDRVLCCQLGSMAANLVKDKKYGYMPVFKNNQMEVISLQEGVKHIKNLDKNSQLVSIAKNLGIYFGD